MSLRSVRRYIGKRRSHGAELAETGGPALCHRRGGGARDTRRPVSFGRAPKHRGASGKTAVVGRRGAMPRVERANARAARTSPVDFGGSPNPLAERAEKRRGHGVEPPGSAGLWPATARPARTSHGGGVHGPAPGASPQPHPETPPPARHRLTVRRRERPAGFLRKVSRSTRFAPNRAPKSSLGASVESRPADKIVRPTARKPHHSITPSLHHSITPRL
jgi:hypothetical protein